MTTDVQTSSILAEIDAEYRHQGTAQGDICGVLSDDEGKLAMAAAAFAVQSTGAGSGADILWPSSSLMPVCESRRHCLIVAAALIVREIKRIDGFGGLTADAIAQMREGILGLPKYELVPLINQSGAAA